MLRPNENKNITDAVENSFLDKLPLQFWQCAVRL